MFHRSPTPAGARDEERISDVEVGDVSTDGDGDGLKDLDATAARKKILKLFALNPKLRQEMLYVDRSLFQF